MWTALGGQKRVARRPASIPDLVVSINVGLALVESVHVESVRPLAAVFAEQYCVQAGCTLGRKDGSESPTGIECN